MCQRKHAYQNVPFYKREIPTCTSTYIGKSRLLFKRRFNIVDFSNIGVIIVFNKFAFLKVKFTIRNVIINS